MSYANFVRATVTTPLDVAATSITLVASAAPFNLPPADGGTLVISDSVGNPSLVEIITYASRSGSVLSGVVRGREGTTARTWTGTVFCYQSITAASLAADLATKEPVVAADSISKFWSGTKAWRDFATDVRAAVLTGFSATTQTAVVATDSVLAAIGKLQAQLSAKLNSSAVSTFGLTLVDDADAATARTTLGLGTAATATVTTSTSDTTVGRVMRVGDFGLGNPTAITDYNSATTAGRYSPGSPYTNGPAGHEAGVLEVIVAGTQILQRAWVHNTIFGNVYEHIRRYNGSTWAAWQLSAVNLDSTTFATLSLGAVEVGNITGTSDLFVTGEVFRRATMTGNTTISFNGFWLGNNFSSEFYLELLGAFTPAFTGVTWLGGGAAPKYTAGMIYKFVSHKDSGGTLRVFGSVVGDGQNLGVGQTWQNLTASRVEGTTYTNSTGKPIAVQVWTTSATDADDIILTIGGIYVDRVAGGGGTASRLCVRGIVPNGATYLVTAPGRVIAEWVELR